MAAVELVCVLMGEPTTTLSHWEVFVLGRQETSWDRKVGIPLRAPPAPQHMCSDGCHRKHKMGRAVSLKSHAENGSLTKALEKGEPTVREN